MRSNLPLPAYCPLLSARRILYAYILQLFSVCPFSDLHSSALLSGFCFSSALFPLPSSASLSCGFQFPMAHLPDGSEKLSQNHTIADLRHFMHLGILFVFDFSFLAKCHLLRIPAGLCISHHQLRSGICYVASFSPMIPERFPSGFFIVTASILWYSIHNESHQEATYELLRNRKYPSVLPPL